MRITFALLASLSLFTLATAQAAEFPVMTETPSGEGDPDAVVCRAPQALPDSGAFGPKICMHNNVWARLTMTGQDLSADGKNVFPRPTVAEPTGAATRTPLLAADRSSLPLVAPSMARKCVSPTAIGRS